MEISQTSARLLDKLFNIRPNEWARVLPLFLIAALSNAGFFWGGIISYAAFVNGKNGLGILLWIIILTAILSAIAIALYTPFVDRIADRKLHLFIFGIECGGIIFGLLLIGFNQSAIAYPFLYILSIVAISAANPHQVTYFNNFYNTQTAKRTLPIINAGYRVGGIAAGLIMPGLNRLFSNDPQGIVVIWLLMHLLVMSIVWLLPYLSKDDNRATDEMPVSSKRLKQQPSYLDNIQEGFRYTIQSTYLRWMAISTLLLMALMALLEYRSTELFLEKFNTTTELANFIGQLGAIGDFLVVPILLFGISRIIARLGLNNTSLIFPSGNLLICAGLIFSPGWPTASVAHLARGSFRFAFQYPIDGLLYNAVSVWVKGRVRAFVSGLLGPIGRLMGGLFLLAFVGFIPLPWVIVMLIGILAAAYLASAFVIRKLYSEALVQMLEQENYSFLLAQEASDLNIADPATLKSLQEKLAASDNSQFTIFMAKLISQIGGTHSAKILIGAVSAAKDPDTRAGIVDVMVVAEMGGESVQQLYTDLLSDPNGKVRQTALTGLEYLMGVGHEQFNSLILPMLDDPDIEVTTQILSSLAYAENFYALPAAVEVLNQILAQANPQERARGVAVLGQVAYVCTSRRLHEVTKPVYRLTTYLFDSADHVRLQAALAIEKVSANRVTDHLAELIIQQISSAVKDPVERIRQAALVVYSHLGKREAHPILVEALADTSPQVRETAVKLLAQIGKSVIPTLHPLMLNSTDSNLRKTIALVLSRIDKQTYSPLISAHVTNNLLTIYRYHGYLTALSAYSAYTSIAVLQSALQERNQYFLNEVFYLLSALHDPDWLKTIAASLRSENVLTRANAIEAIESITTPQTARLIAPLCDPHVEPNYLLQLSHETWDMQHPDSAQMIAALTEIDDKWLKAMSIFALAEMSGEELPPEIPANFDAIIESAINDPDIEVRIAAKSAKRMRAGIQVIDVRMAAHTVNRMLTDSAQKAVINEEEFMLSTIEKIIFLKKVPFFARMTVEQLKTLAGVCEEELFEEDAHIFNEGDPGGTLYVVVSGKVAIEKEGKRKGSFARIDTLQAYSYFGEMNLFDNSPYTHSATAIQDTLTLRLHREPLIALARQHPDMSLELINILSQRLREVNDQVVELTRSKPRELHKLFDKLD